MSESYAIESHEHVPPWAKTRGEIENPILADQRMEHVCHKLNHRLVLRVVCRKGQTEVQDGVSIVA